MAKNTSKAYGLPTEVPDADITGNVSPSVRLNHSTKHTSAAISAMAEALRPLRELEEALRRLRKPLSEISDLTRKSLTNFANIAISVRAPTVPFTRISENLRFTPDLDRINLEVTRKAILNPAVEFTEAIRRTTVPFEEISDAIRRMAISTDAVATGVNKALTSLQLQNDLLAKALAGPALQVLSLKNFMQTAPDPFGAHFQAMALTSRTLSNAVRKHEELRLKSAKVPVETRSLLLDGLAIIDEETSHGIARDKVKHVWWRLLNIFMQRIDHAASVFEQQRLMGVITVLSFFLTFYFEAQGDAQHLEAMESIKLLPTQLQMIDSMRDAWEKSGNEGGKSLAVVMKRANLRPTPDTNGKRLALLDEAEIVEFLELSNGWAKVRYLDVVADKVFEGWVYVRLIRVLQRN